MPSCSWSATGWSCCEANQPGSGADIELWVAAKATVSSDREHRSAVAGIGGGSGGRCSASADEGGDGGNDEDAGDPGGGQRPAAMSARRPGRDRLCRCRRLARPVDERQDGADAREDEVEPGGSENQLEHGVAV